MRWSLIVLAVAGLLICFAGRATRAEQTPVQHLKTPEGVAYGLWNPQGKKRAPTLFVLAGTIDTTLGSTYFRQCGNELSRHGWACVSVDLPCHGQQMVAGEPSGLNGWSRQAAAKQDFVAQCNTRLSQVLDHLIKTGVTDPDRIAACGTSRGGFLAIHFAAHDQRVGCAAGFAPVTDLSALSEFRSIADQPFVAGLSLEACADRLAGRPVWIVIGDQDERVGTERAVSFAMKLVAAARKKKVPSRVAVHVVPEPRGHTTPPGSSRQAAGWILNHFEEAKPNSTERDGEN